MAGIIVQTIAYKSFIDNYNEIKIPDYQRPYRWSKDKVIDLLEDLNEFFLEKPVENLDYYIGGVLLFKNKEKECYEVIDGQQRLTTLNLMYYVLNGEVIKGQEFKFNSHLSFYHIRENLNCIQENKALLKKLVDKNVFEKLVFTLIISDNEDQSFAFFDSQNNRGVSLAADDYLKAYHLREVASEELQSKLAQEWEQAAIKAQNEINVEKGLLHLFYKILYRSREWKGQSKIIPETKEQILQSFQKKALKPQNNNSYRLFAGKDNLRFSKMSLDENEAIIPIESNTKELQAVEKLPFSIRQPLYKGLNFFQFTQKYYAIHQLLFYSENDDDVNIINVRTFYKKIYTDDMSEYLRHYMQLCLVMYYDTFGSLEIDKAIQFFDYFMGSIRISKFYVRREAVKNSLMYSTNNLLDVLAHSFLPKEVFDFIKNQTNIKGIYEVENLGNVGGVKERYKERVLSYYKKEENSLKKRLQWIK